MIEALSLPLQPMEGGSEPHFLSIDPGGITGRRIRTASSTDG